MKKLLLFLLCCLFAVGCSDYLVEINQKPQKPEESVFTIDSDGNYIVEAKGGEVVVKVTTNIEYDVVIPDAASWLSLADTRAAREETLTFSVAENDDIEARMVEVLLVDADGKELQSITINQNGADPVFATDCEGNYVVEAKGGEVLVKVTTNLQYNIVIAEDASWVAVGDTRAVREETLRFTASENEELEERATVVEFKSVDGEVLQSITIKQKGADPLFTTDGEGNYLVAAEGGNISVNITTNLQYNVVIEDDASWVSVLDTRAVREETLTVAVAKNDEFEERSATLKLVDSKNNTLQKITITQESDAANVPDNQIWYLATSQIAPNAEAVFGANIISHDFADGKGVITFDGAVKSITNQAFAKCADLTMIALPQSVESIEEGCFAECANLEMLISSFATLDNRALVVDGVMVAFAPKGLASYTTPAAAKRIGEYTFAYCLELVNVTIDYDIEVIGAWSFTHCEELVNAHIADSVTTIEAGAFSYCYKLGMSGAYTIECGCIMRGGTVVGLVEGIEASGTGGGYLLSIPSYTTSIATGTFMGNGDINEVVIPASVTEIYAWAFTGCHNLVRVICEPLVPPTAVFVDGVWDSFDDQHADRKIYVPRSSVEAYREAEGWKKYADDILSIDGIDPSIPETHIIYYTAEAMVEPYGNTTNANIVENRWDENTGEGVMIFDGVVTTVGDYAFAECAHLHSITLPDSVETIGLYAFYCCWNLANVDLGKGVTTIGNYAFFYCSNLISVTIPDSVTTIGVSVFSGCESLSEIRGNRVSDDGRCYIDDDGTLILFAPAGLTEYTIPDSVTTIGESAFRGCSSLTSVTIPNSVTSMYDGAFAGCYNLSEFKGKFASEDGRCLIVNGRLSSFAPAGLVEYAIPENVTVIGSGAFAFCADLVNVTIGDSVYEIASEAFQQCNGLTNVVIPDSVTTIGNAAFFACQNLESMTIGNGVTYIGEWAFQQCRNLKTLTLGNGLMVIDNYAFSICTSLEEVVIPESVTHIGATAFWSCSSLSSIYCKATTPPVGAYSMFSDIASYFTIYVPVESVDAYKAASYWSNYADAIVGYDFENGVAVTPKTANNEIWYTNGSTTEATIPYETTAFGANIVSNTYDGAKECWVIKFDSEVTSIGEDAFYWCESLTSVTIPDSVTEIGEDAFAWCGSLTSVTIPDSVTEIGNYAFYWCESLTSAAIPDSVTEIGDEAFAWCGSLTSITIPDSVTTIGYAALQGCRSLTSVTIPDSVTEIGENAFHICTSLTSVTIPDSVTTIGEGAFWGCTSLQEFNGKFASEDSRCLIVDGVLNSFAIGCSATEYTIPDSVTTIGYAALQGCRSLTSVTIPDSVTEIGDEAFAHCSSLTSVTIPDSVTTIGKLAFYSCNSLTSVTIPDSVTSIGGSAFGYCRNLTSVYCKPTTPPAGDDYMFSNNASGRKIYVPMESVNNYKSASYWKEYASDIVGYDF